LLGLALLLAFVPSASAWTKLGAGGLDNTVDPSPLVLASGTTLVAFREPKARAVVVAVDGMPHTVATGLASVGDPRLVQLPNGSLVLFVADQNGVESFTSAGGTSWTGPAKTGSTDTGDVQAAAARPDGTPLFSQDGTGFVNVYQGSGGHNVFPRCCGYAESLAVDSHGLGQIAFWSNATGKSGYLWGRLDSGGALLGGLKKLTSGQTAENDARVPLVADESGNTFVGFANGYPAPTSFVVQTMRDGVAVHKVTLGKGPFTGNEPLMALAVDRSGRLWAVWTQGDSVLAARSRSHGAHFGATVHVAIPGSAYVLEAAAQADGSVDAIANDGSALQTQKLLPGLTVIPSLGGVRVLDDGFPVAGASVQGAGKSVHTNAAGGARLGNVPRHTAVSVTASGYAPASGATA
jgi:hypothetical protein